MPRTVRECTVQGCDRTTDRGYLCARHEFRKRKNGHPLAGRAFKGEALAFLQALVGHEGHGCVFWPFGVGYGALRVDGKKVTATRHMCALAHGDPPKPNLDAAHSCGNGHLGCVNPNHLRWATRSENVADAMNHGRRPGPPQQARVHTSRP